MISLAEADPHIVAEPDERRAQQGNRQEEQRGGAIDMLQPHGRAGKRHDKQQARAHPTGQREVRSIVQYARPSVQPWEIRFQPGPGSSSSMSFS